MNLLGLLNVFYSTVLISANWFDPRLIDIFGLITGAGALIFPLTYVLLDIITEVYGYKNARLAVWIGFMFNIFFLLYGQIINYLPSPDSINRALFNNLLNFNIKIVIGSILAYLFTEFLNSYILSKLKILFLGKLIGIRFILSTFIAHILNLIIFCPIVFYGVMNNKDLLRFILTSWMIMVTIELLLLPISVRLAKKLKQIEKLDMYDQKTRYNIFSLDTTYSSENNKFKRK